MTTSKYQAETTAGESLICKNTYIIIHEMVFWQCKSCAVRSCRLSCPDDDDDGGLSGCKQNLTKWKAPRAPPPLSTSAVLPKAWRVSCRKDSLSFTPS